jgi:hypothetical protein
MKNPQAIRRVVDELVQATPVFDIHTHLYDPAFRSLLLWGIDELLVYHYLVAEAFRYLDMPADDFWRMPKHRQAEIIWEQLFVRHSPVSEACRGVITTLSRLGLEVRRRDLRSLRGWFRAQKIERYVGDVLRIAGVCKVCMTNSPFDDEERPVWERGFRRDARFLAALRVDALLMDWPDTARRLTEWGYPCEVRINARTADQVRRFLAHWAKRIDAQYLMVSLPPSFGYPAKNACTQLIDKAVLPFCREHGLALALMLGVQRAVNPELRLAGDGVGRSDLSALVNLCAAHADIRFLATVLSRENQHELCVVARKFRNLHVFGCWWFTNVPQIIDEMTRMRLELIGLSCTPQHSDARVLDQVIYKWAHFRAILSRALGDKYCDLAAAGWPVTPQAVRRDVEQLLGGGFEEFVRR